MLDAPVPTERLVPVIAPPAIAPELLAVSDVPVIAPELVIAPEPMVPAPDIFPVFVIPPLLLSIPPEISAPPAVTVNPPAVAVKPPVVAVIPVAAVIVRLDEMEPVPDVEISPLTVEIAPVPDVEIFPLASAVKLLAVTFPPESIFPDAFIAAVVVVPVALRVVKEPDPPEIGEFVIVEAFKVAPSMVPPSISTVEKFPAAGVVPPTMVPSIVPPFMSTVEKLPAAGVAPPIMVLFMVPPVIVAEDVVTDVAFIVVPSIVPLFMSALLITTEPVPCGVTSIFPLSALSITILLLPEVVPFVCRIRSLVEDGVVRYTSSVPEDSPRLAISPVILNVPAVAFVISSFLNLILSSLRLDKAFLASVPSRNILAV